MSHARRGVPSHGPFDSLFNSLLRLTSKESFKGVSLVLYEGITGGYPDQGPVTRRAFPFHDVIMSFVMHLFDHPHVFGCFPWQCGHDPHLKSWRIWLRMTGTKPQHHTTQMEKGYCNVLHLTNHRADSRFAPSQWETALLCNDVSYCLGANLEWALNHVCPW